MMRLDNLEDFVEVLAAFHETLHRTGEHLAGRVLRSVQPVFQQNLLLLLLQNHGVQCVLDFWTLQRVFSVTWLASFRDSVEDVQRALQHYFGEDLKHLLETKIRRDHRVVGRGLAFTCRNQIRFQLFLEELNFGILGEFDFQCRFESFLRDFKFFVYLFFDFLDLFLDAWVL